MAKFTVDTHLFRELGELLVGRDSTALVELVKNAYDADATRVTVHGHQIHDPEGGWIEIVDDGVGMTKQQFELGFLRIASRTKESGDRRSVRFGRRYTGAKGIGRLAAHKLARIVAVETVPWLSGGSAAEAIRATIDWDGVEQCNTLDEVGSALRVATFAPDEIGRHGTRLSLQRLRRRWSERELIRFVADVHTFEPPRPFRDALPANLFVGPALFEEPSVRDASRDDPGFTVSLSGDFSVGDEWWTTIGHEADWLLEIDATPERVAYAIRPSQRHVERYPDAQPSTVHTPHPDAPSGPFFQARIFVREGAPPGGRELQQWYRASAGIRMFMEGFRVPPYGEFGDDWLGIGRQYTARGRDLPWLAQLGLESALGGPVRDEGLSVLPVGNFFGGVFLTEERSGGLRMLVNREGFIPDARFDVLMDTVRAGVQLLIRARALSTVSQRRTGQAVGRSRVPSTNPSHIAPAPTSALASATTRASEHASEAHRKLSVSDMEGATAAVGDVLRALEEVRISSEDIRDEQALLRVLASVGTQMTAFVHELSGLISLAQTVHGALLDLLESTSLDPRQRKKLRALADAVSALRQGLERQGSFLTDVISRDARRRRSKQLLDERFATAIRLLAPTAERQQVRLINEVPPGLKTPAMFPAELTAVFTNLLTNAIKAAGRGGRVMARASQSSAGLRFVLENTGELVDPANGEQWFRPFASSSVSPEPSLGQGMGMGLPITRRMLQPYGANLRFVKPSRGFSTAIEVTFPG